MASAGSLIFELAADVSRLRTDMGKAQGEIMEALKSIRESSAAEALMTGAEYAKEFARGFAEKIQQAIEQGDALGKLAQRIGTSTEALSALTYAGKFAGVSTDDLTTAFKGLNKALLEARDPASNSASALQALGLNVQQLQAEDPAKAFEDIAQAMSGFQDGAEKAAVATQLFGKEGQKLIPLMNEGKEGLAEARKEAESLGLIVSGTTAKAMSDLNDDIQRLKNASEGAAAIIAEQLTVSLDTLVKSITTAHQEGDAWNEILKFIGTTISDLILDLTDLAGEIAIVWKELQGYSAAVKQFFAGDFKQAMETTKAAANQSMASMDELTARLTKAKALQREMSDNPIDLGNTAAGWDDANKKALKYTATLDANAAANKTAKKAVDEYAQMLNQLSEQLRKTAADGDAMQELLTDPKFAKMTKAQQQNLIDLTAANIALTQAQKDRKTQEDELAKARDDADKAEVKRVEDLRNFASAQMDAIDPTRKYIDTITKLVEAQKAGFVTAQEFGQIQKKAMDDLAAATQKVDPLAASFKSLQQAIEGFGKQSSDAFVNFIFNTKDASTSFSQMVSTMLQDLAKMLVYQNVMKPLFSSISSGFGEGGFAQTFMSSIINRMAGGPVSPGQLYQVNELPGRPEFFIPNVAGNIVTGGAGGAGSSGPNVQVNVHMHKDSQSTEDTKADNDRARELGKRISAVVKQTIVNEKRTGGLLATP
jgi:hypothetical protein